MVTFWNDYVLTLKKWSWQINFANFIWSGGALLAYQMDMLPLWFLKPAFVVALILMAASGVVQFVPQKDIITVKRGPVDGFHEEGR